jgi:fumarate reductase subunit D
MDTPNPQSSAPVNGTVVPKFDPKDKKENAVYAALSYVSVVSLVMLIMKKDSPFVQEHAKQGVILFLVEIAVWLIAAIIPFFGWFIIGPLANLLLLIVSVIGLAHAYQGEFWEIPVIGRYRSKINF